MHYNLYEKDENNKLQGELGTTRAKVDELADEILTADQAKSDAVVAAEHTVHLRNAYTTIRSTLI